MGTPGKLISSFCIAHCLGQKISKNGTAKFSFSIKLKTNYVSINLKTK